MALTTPTIQELREFYPITASLDDEKREEAANYVKNHIWVSMFGYEAAAAIYGGVIVDAAPFIGFQKFLALCCAYYIIKDPLVSTNFGAKTIDRIGALNPTNNQKSITLIDMESTISIHYKAALAIVSNSKCGDVPTWGGYFSYKVSRL